MFGSEALDIVIGLVLIFLLVSIMLTALSEVIEAMLKTRAADLERAIAMMLQDPEGTSEKVVEQFYRHPLIFSLFRQDYAPQTKSWFFMRPQGRGLPSYIPRDLFSTAALDLVTKNDGGKALAGVVEAIKTTYGDDIAKQKAQLENWYDGVMDRASGWYKRRTQKLVFWLALVIAIAFNINPIVISRYLAETPEARATLVQMAEETTQGDEGAACKQSAANWDEVTRCRDALAQVGLPIGWTAMTWQQTFPGARGLGDALLSLSLLVALVGWATTALAATLGAPFWFDLLNKIMVVRATVKPKEKSGDEGSEDRTAKKTVVTTTTP
jgi:hypothetical protein